MTPAALAMLLPLCLSPPVPMPELVGQMARDGFRYSEGVEDGPTGAVLVSVVRADGAGRLMLVLSEEWACEVRGDPS